MSNLTDINEWVGAEIGDYREKCAQLRLEVDGDHEEEEERSITDPGRQAGEDSRQRT
jgi:hypothetical protein